MEEGLSCLYLDVGRIEHNPCSTPREALKEAINKCGLSDQFVRYIGPRSVVSSSSRETRREPSPREWLSEEHGEGKSDSGGGVYERRAERFIKGVREKPAPRSADTKVRVLVDLDSEPERSLDQIELVCNNLPIDVYLFRGNPRAFGTSRIDERRWVRGNETAATHRERHGRFVLSARAAEAVGKDKTVVIVTDSLYGYELEAQLGEIANARTINPAIFHAGELLLDLFEARGAEVDRKRGLKQLLATLRELSVPELQGRVTACSFLEETRGRDFEAYSRYGTPVDFAIAALSFYSLERRQETAAHWDAYLKERKYSSAGLLNNRKMKAIYDRKRLVSEAEFPEWVVS